MMTENELKAADTGTKPERIANTVVFWLFGITMLTILVSVCFFSSSAYPCKRDWFSNIVILCAAVPGCFLVRILPARYTAGLKAGWWKIMLVFLLLAFQILSVYNYFFYTGWDVKTVIGTSTSLAHGEKISKKILNYYSTYPNNLFMTSVFSTIVRIVDYVAPQAVGTEAEYVVLLVIQCIINQLTGVLLYCTAKRLCGRERYAWLAYALYIGLIGISPWVSIPYSDSMGLIFPILIFALYLRKVPGRKVILKWLAMAGLGWIGYHVKPQTAILSISIMIMEAFSLGRLIRENRSGLLRAGAGVILGVLCGMGIVAGSIRVSAPLQVDPEKRLGAAHFLMMGMNPKNGTWNQEDVKFSRSVEGVQERDRADLERAGERIREMGVGGLLEQLVLKTLINFNDGSFAWEKEGNFYSTIREEPGGGFSAFLRNVYYADGKYQKLWLQLAQGIWVCVLGCSVFAVFSRKDKQTAVLMLTIAGLAVFLFLFEARASYVYSNVPILILLAVKGISSVKRKASLTASVESPT